MKITLAYDQKINGRKRKADSTLDVHRDIAQSLIYKGLAREADTDIREQAEEPVLEQVEEPVNSNSEGNE